MEEGGTHFFQRPDEQNDNVRVKNPSDLSNSPIRATLVCRQTKIVVYIYILYVFFGGEGGGTSRSMVVSSFHMPHHLSFD